MHKNYQINIDKLSIMPYNVDRTREEELIKIIWRMILHPFTWPINMKEWVQWSKMLSPKSNEGASDEQLISLIFWVP